MNKYSNIRTFNYFFFFFFKQKTAYEIPLRLVGSEMCIRDRTYYYYGDMNGYKKGEYSTLPEAKGEVNAIDSLLVICLLYTSDAADEEDSVDLGGRRIIKKKT
ncbi:hypothetical protein [Lactobacillus paraplantarum] [Lactiplantibacillus mudanjiangensis]|nr:hypothetical protein [Lactobacillus paraplantarum] [Lactiplantibacillus mudanjiangensis]